MFVAARRLAGSTSAVFHCATAAGNVSLRYMSVNAMGDDESVSLTRSKRGNCSDGILTTEKGVNINSTPVLFHRTPFYLQRNVPRFPPPTPLPTLRIQPSRYLLLPPCHPMIGFHTTTGRQDCSVATLYFRRVALLKLKSASTHLRSAICNTSLALMIVDFHAVLLLRSQAGGNSKM